MMHVKIGSFNIKNSGVFTARISTQWPILQTRLYFAIVKYQLSVDEIEGDTFKMKLFPNPVLDKLYIEVEGEPHESLNYRIYNNLGYQLISGKIKTGTKHAIDVQKLEKGFYILNIITDDGMQSSRFIKM